MPRRISVCDVAAVRRIPASQPLERQAAYFDLMYLARHSSFARAFYNWASFGHLYAEGAVANNFAEIVSMVRAHEGDASARIAEDWLAPQPQAFIAFRGDLDVRARLTIGADGVNDRDAAADSCREPSNAVRQSSITRTCQLRVPRALDQVAARGSPAIARRSPADDGHQCT